MHEAFRRRHVAELIDAGRRSAKPAKCHRCHAPTIRGEDHDETAAIVNVDPEPLDPASEALALMAGGHTFDLLPMRGKGAGAHALHIRQPWHYLTERDHGGTVHAAHQCERTP